MEVALGMQRDLADNTQRLLHTKALLLQYILIVLKYGLNRIQQASFDFAVIAFWRERQRDLVPDKVGAWNLLVEATGWLEYNGIGEDHDAPGWLGIRSGRGEFHKVQADEANIHDLTGNSGNLYPVSDA